MKTLPNRLFEPIVKERIEDSESSADSLNLNRHFCEAPRLTLPKMQTVPGQPTLAPSYRKGSLNSCYNNVDIFQVDKTFTTALPDYSTHLNQTQQQRKQLRWA